MPEQMTKDDLLDLQELSTKLLTSMHVIFEGCDANIIMSTLNLTMFTILKEFQKSCEGSRDVLALFVEALYRLNSSELSKSIDDRETNGSV